MDDVCISWSQGLPNEDRQAQSKARVVKYNFWKGEQLEDMARPPDPTEPRGENAIQKTVNRLISLKNKVGLNQKHPKRNNSGVFFYMPHDDAV